MNRDEPWIFQIFLYQNIVTRTGDLSRAFDVFNRFLKPSFIDHFGSQRRENRRLKSSQINCSQKTARFQSRECLVIACCRLVSVFPR